MNDRTTFIEYARYFLVGAFIILVVSSAVFIIYTLSLPREKRPLIARQESPAAAPETTAAAAPPVHIPANTSGTPPASPAVQPQMQPTRATGPAVQRPLPPVRKLPDIYTVYIATYTVEPPAAEEVSRWTDAGYIASVVRTRRHFRVALGQYESVPEAQSFAEGMFEAFENGYWIGVIE